MEKCFKVSVENCFKGSVWRSVFKEQCVEVCLKDQCGEVF